MFAITFLRYSVLLLVIGALIASVAANVQDDKRDSERNPNQVLDLNFKDCIKNKQVFESFKQALAQDTKNKDVQSLVDARLVVSTQRCTDEYNQWLRRMLAQYDRPPFDSYMTEIRIQCRTLCSQTIKQRFQAVLAQVEPDKIKLVGKFSALLGETSRLHDNIFEKDDVSAASLVPAIKKYTGHKVNSKYPSEQDKTREPQKTGRQVSAALAPLLETCAELTRKLEDFLLTLRVIEWPRNLESDIVEALWATKVCRSLRFEHFEADLSTRWTRIGTAKLKMVEKFNELLYMSYDDLSEPETIKHKIDVLVEGRKRHSQEGLERSEVLDKLRREYGEACASFVREMSNFLYLVDMRLKSANFSRYTSIKRLNQARACEVFQSISY